MVRRATIPQTQRSKRYRATTRKQRAARFADKKQKVPVIETVPSRSLIEIEICKQRQTLHNTLQTPDEQLPCFSQGFQRYEKTVNVC
jgi:hypothetical protein